MFVGGSLTRNGAQNAVSGNAKMMINAAMIFIDSPFAFHGFPPKARGNDVVLISFFMDSRQSLSPQVLGGEHAGMTWCSFHLSLFTLHSSRFSPFTNTDTAG